MSRRLTREDRIWMRFETDLHTKPLSSWTCLGFIGRGYPNSLYKLLLKQGPNHWLHFQWDVMRLNGNPMKWYFDKLDGYRPPPEVLHGPLELLRSVTCDPTREALVRGLAMVQARLADGRR